MMNYRELLIIYGIVNGSRLEGNDLDLMPILRKLEAMMERLPRLRWP